MERNVMGTIGTCLSIANLNGPFLKFFIVGASGAILSYIMSKGMNRSILSVVLGGFGGEQSNAGVHDNSDKIVKQGNAEDAAYILKNADSVIIVPGYGMAVAQAQHALREMGDILKKEGKMIASLMSNRTTKVTRIGIPVKNNKDSYIGQVGAS